MTAAWTLSFFSILWTNSHRVHHESREVLRVPTWNERNENVRCVWSVHNKQSNKLKIIKTEKFISLRAITNFRRNLTFDMFRSKCAVVVVVVAHCLNSIFTIISFAWDACVWKHGRPSCAIVWKNRIWYFCRLVTCSQFFSFILWFF